MCWPHHACLRANGIQSDSLADGCPVMSVTQICSVSVVVYACLMVWMGQLVGLALGIQESSSFLGALVGGM